MKPEDLEAIEKEQMFLLVGDYKDIGVAKAELNYQRRQW